MRTIQKQISLEPMKSRLPSVWPSYLNNEDGLYYFDDASLSGRSWQYTSNWGMIPVNIVLNTKPDSNVYSGTSAFTAYSLDTSSHCYGSGQMLDIGCSVSGESFYDELSNFTLSFDNLSKWYHFFTEYYNLLKRHGHCNRVYTSAEDYYNYESGGKYSNQMVYGSDKQTYLDIDAEFIDKGGVVEVLVFNKDSSGYETKSPDDAYDESEEDRLSMVDVYDVGFFKWICDNIVPSFTIPMRYRDYWNRDYLFYPDVIKWLAWFKERIHYDEGDNLYITSENGEVDRWNCKNDNIDCCDCEEYFNRGGKRIYDAMLNWYENIQETIISNNEIISSSTNCFIPTIILPTSLQLSIDDLGEKSIFSKEYELGIDYRVCNYGDSANTISGTVSTMSGNSMILCSGNGYTFDDAYMEMHPDGWKSYTDHYINNEDECAYYVNKNDFYVSAFTYYSFDNDNVKYVTSAQTLESAREDLLTKMSKKYQINYSDNGWVLIGNILYNIEESEYGIYDENNKYLGGKKYMVYREEFTNTPYTFINGKQIYADFDNYKMIFTFPFFNEKFKRNEISDDTMSYIKYNDNVYEVSNESSSVVINDVEYYKISGYCLDNSNNPLYVDFNGSIRSGITLEELDNAHLSSDNLFVEVDYPSDIEIYPINIINGVTVSKLGDLRLYNVLTDDVGNTIDGIYEIGTETMNFQPPQCSELELIYQVGNTANITRFSRTAQDLEEIENNTNYFVGDFIKEMKFYYKEVNGSVPSGVTTSVVMDENNKIIVSGNNVTVTVDSGYTSLSAISISTSAKTDYENMEEEIHIFDNDIFCDITYYIGATLIRRNGKCFNLSYENGINNNGVEYSETVKFIKKNKEYYCQKATANDVIPTRKNDVSAHSISYPIYVYELEQNMEHVDNSQYDSSYSVPISKFKSEINVFSGSTDTYSAKYPYDMTAHNNLQVFPTFREEYRIGTAMIENVDSDIYIDRGINAAFEKHLKLGEVHSLDDMIKYGNGYFKIMEN